jgi:uncharacterized paraquat-inducible protein A
MKTDRSCSETDGISTQEQGSVLGQYDELFGTIMCPECHDVWSEEFVPESCPKCGIRLAYRRGEGCERFVRMIEKAALGMKILVCDHCGERYLDTPNLVACLRCHHDLRPRSPIGRLRRAVRLALWSIKYRVRRL